MARTVVNFAPNRGGVSGGHPKSQKIARRPPPPGGRVPRPPNVNQLPVQQLRKDTQHNFKWPHQVGQAVVLKNTVFDTKCASLHGNGIQDPLKSRSPRKTQTHGTKVVVSVTIVEMGHPTHCQTQSPTRLPPPCLPVCLARVERSIVNCRPTLLGCNGGKIHHS